jgi:hypothetical protein
MEANYKTHDLFSGLEAVFGDLYQTVAGKPFVPYVRKPKTAVSAAMDAAVQKAELSRLESLKAMAS